MRITKYLAVMVTVLAVVSLVMGIVTIVQGSSAKAKIAEELRAEDVTLGLPKEGEPGYKEGNVVDTAAEAQAAQDMIEKHLRENFGTYGDTERGSPERATYITGTTLRNSLNLAVMGFGVSTIAILSGVFMVIMGVALGGGGIGLLSLARGRSTS